jgi:hypothetical protein
MNEITLRLADIKEDTPVALVTADGRIECSVRDVQRWVAPKAPPHEALKFLMTCKAVGVNPLIGEAHLIEQGAGNFVTIVDKSGWLRKAQSHPAYDGHEAGIIARPWSAATRTFTGPPVEVAGTFLPPDHLLVGGWAKIYRKDRRVPTYQAVSASEYNKNQSSWKTIPCTMIRKVALVQALRESGLTSAAFYVAGEVHEYHSPDDLPTSSPTLAVTATATPTPTMPAIEAQYVEVEDSGCPPDLIDEIDRLRQQLQISADDPSWLNVLVKQGVRSVAEMTPQTASAFRYKLGALVATQEPIINTFTRPAKQAGDVPALTNQ